MLKVMRGYFTGVQHEIRRKTMRWRWIGKAVPGTMVEARSEGPRTRFAVLRQQDGAWRTAAVLDPGLTEVEAWRETVARFRRSPEWGRVVLVQYLGRHVRDVLSQVAGYLYGVVFEVKSRLDKRSSKTL